MIATSIRRRTRAAAQIHTLVRPLRTLTRCLVCGFREVRSDEVVDRGILLLNECPRCDHRWTERPLAPAGAASEEEGAPAAA
jgi:hypothetical protein